METQYPLIKEPVLKATASFLIGLMDYSRKNVRNENDIEEVMAKLDLSDANVLTINSLVKRADEVTTAPGKKVVPGRDIEGEERDTEVDLDPLLKEDVFSDPEEHEAQQKEPVGPDVPRSPGQVGEIEAVINHMLMLLRDTENKVSGEQALQMLAKMNERIKEQGYVDFGDLQKSVEALAEGKSVDELFEKSEETKLLEKAHEMIKEYTTPQEDRPLLSQEEALEQGARWMAEQRGIEYAPAEKPSEGTRKLQPEPTWPVSISPFVDPSASTVPKGTTYQSYPGEGAYLQDLDPLKKVFEEEG